MAAGWCETCNGIIWSAHTHTCPPVWRVYAEDIYGDEYVEVMALDAEQAAEKWAERYDCEGDYTIVSGSEQTVTVTDVHGEDSKKLIVEGEGVPQYTAREVPEQA